MNETAKTETAKTETGKGRPAKTYRETTANDQATIANVVAFLATAKPDIKAWAHPSKHDAYDVAYAMTIDGVNYSVKVYCTPDVSEATQRERIAELTAQNERMARSLRYVGCCQTITFSMFAKGQIGYTVDAGGNKAPDFLAIETVRAELASKGIDAQGRPDDYLLPIAIGDWVYTYSRDNSLGFTVAPVSK